ncbi:hypothetical protein MBLNU459_g4905t1 [Dothideomycetes sp. NU459]
MGSEANSLAKRRREQSPTQEHPNKAIRDLSEDPYAARSNRPRPVCAAPSSSTTDSAVDKLLARFTRAVNNSLSTSVRQDFAQREFAKADRESSLADTEPWRNYPSSCEQKLRAKQRAERELAKANAQSKAQQMELRDALAAMMAAPTSRPEDYVSRKEYDALQKQFHDMQSQLENMSADAKKLKNLIGDDGIGDDGGGIRSIQDKLRKLEDDNTSSAIADEVEEIKSRVSALNWQTEAHEGKLSAIEKDAASQADQISEIDKARQEELATVRRFGERIRIMEELNDLSSMQTQVSGLQSNITVLEERVSTSGKEQDDVMKDLEERLNEIEHQELPALSKVTKDIPKLKTSLFQISAHVLGIKTDVAEVKTIGGQPDELSHPVSTFEEQLLSKLDEVSARLSDTESKFSSTEVQNGELKSDKLFERISKLEEQSTSELDQVSARLSATESKLSLIQSRTKELESKSVPLPGSHAHDAESRIKLLELQFQELRRSVPRGSAVLSATKYDSDLRQIYMHYDEKVRRIREDMNTNEVDAEIKDKLISTEIDGLRAVINGYNEHTNTQIDELKQETYEFRLGTNNKLSGGIVHTNDHNELASVVDNMRQREEKNAYIIQTLENRFNNLQTDELAVLMLRQLEKLYPNLPALRASIERLDNAHQHFQAHMGMTFKQRQDLNNRVARIEIQNDAAKEQLEDGLNEIRKEVVDTVRSALDASRNEVGMDSGTKQNMADIGNSVKSLGERVSALDKDFEGYKNYYDKIGIMQAEVETHAHRLGIGPINWEGM